ncbi:MAG: divergent polysaccharide deacetylase family protein [Gammaproteobacteria bacterium]|nr:divergent polysaccharide deacetylase family protein [Gammaproteobacteria bacterium]
MIIINTNPVAIADQPSDNKSVIAIVISGVGINKQTGSRAAKLPGPVALAIVPNAKHSQHLARVAHANQKEVLLHQPMAVTIDDTDSATAFITTTTNRLDFHLLLLDNLRSLPHVCGINLQHGNVLAQHPGHMRWLMEDLSAIDKQLVFIDSQTDADSIAMSSAKSLAVPAAQADVVLGGAQDVADIERQWRRLLALAKIRGFALGLVQPHPETLTLLESKLTNLDNAYELWPLAEYIPAAQYRPELRHWNGAEKSTTVQVNQASHATGVRYF